MAGNDQAASIQACALRATRLNSDGSIAYGQTAMIVTDTLISFEFSPEYEDGEEITVTSGCGNISHNYVEPSKLKRGTGTLAIADPDVELSEMATGGTLITSGGMSIGYAAPAVGAVSNNGVCLELWTKAWDGGSAPAGRSVSDGVTTTADATITSATAAFTAADVGKRISGPGIPNGTRILSLTSATEVELTANATATATGVPLSISSPGTFFQWVFPRWTGNIGSFTLENAAKENTFEGPCLENKGIAAGGPAGDWPAGAPVGRVYSYFRTDSMPSIPATPGYLEL